ncbi:MULTISPECIES: PaaI family thioesterase [unclassified Pseudomonas]|uniref:PaaI family thioesterase n=1 Tax=unclassified Pseudomonas TaxID=196821 RepID=UPI001F16B038|nr:MULTISPECIES: PaaI family thioesterase [unclassified Pseudomonas]
MNRSATPQDPLTQMAHRFLSAIRHCQHLGMQVHQADGEGMTLMLPWSDLLVGDPHTGAVHGGVLATLMDTACGMATLCALPRFEVCPTLDLRIDYLRPAKPGVALYGHACCYRITPEVIFTRGFAYQDNAQETLCQVVGTFMRLGGQARGGLNFASAEQGGEA